MRKLDFRIGEIEQHATRGVSNQPGTCLRDCLRGRMGAKDSNYQIVYRGQTLDVYRPGGWVFFQRAKECGGGYWLGRTHDNVFMIEYERPISLREGMLFLLSMKQVEAKSDDFDPYFTLF